MNPSILLQAPIAGCMRWGAWGAGFSKAEYRDMIDQCLELGIQSFDHADIYGDYTTEEEFGEVLKEDKTLRSRLKLITKCGIKMVSENRPDHQVKSYHTGRKHILQSVEQSLKHFGTDYLDVLLIHRPDPLLNPAEVAEAIQVLQQQGKVLAFGVSNFMPHQAEVLRQWVPLSYHQLEISVIAQAPFTNGQLDHCLQHKIVPMAWAPLGGGVFTDDLHPHFRSITQTATELAEQYGVGINEILLAFLNSHPSGILPVIGTTRIDRLAAARKAANIKLRREDWFLLRKAALGEDVA